MNAGGMLSLTCFATRVHNISGDVSIRWVGPDGIAITSGGSLQLESSQVSGNVNYLTLQFSPLYTSHGGVYTCESTFDSDSIRYTISTIEEVVVTGKHNQNMNETKNLTCLLSPLLICSTSPRDHHCC